MKEIQQIKAILEKQETLLKINNKAILELERKLEKTENSQELSRLRLFINRYKELNKEVKKGIKCNKEILKVLEK